MRSRSTRSSTLAAVVAAVAVVTLPGCGDSGDEPAESSPSTTGRAPAPAPLASLAAPLQAAVDADLAADPQLVGQIVLVRSGDAEVTAAAGSADPTAGVPIDPSMSFRIASVTKTFVAAATLRLVEQGEFELDDAVGPLLPDDLTTLLVEGGYRPDLITVRQLLTHTSGILDFTFGPGMNYVDTILADPQRVWTRRDQVALAMTGEPVGMPGQTYHYSDTGYALSGAILEEATGSDLGSALRSLLDFERLGLDHTYLESIEPAPRGTPDRIHQFFGDRDTYDWSPTIDLYGGGGLVSTLDDLTTFFTALLSGEVFDEPATLDLMLDVPATNADVRVPGDPRPYAASAGLFRSEIAGTDCYGHEGFWGVSVTVCPEVDAAYAISVSQATRSAAYDPARLLEVIWEG